MVGAPGACTAYVRRAEIAWLRGSLHDDCLAVAQMSDERMLKAGILLRASQCLKREILGCSTGLSQCSMMQTILASINVNDARGERVNLQHKKLSEAHHDNTTNMLIPHASGMALPAVKTLVDCADYTQTFEPFIPQLYALPEQVWASLGDLEALKQIYISTNPAIFGLALALAAFPIFWIISEINKNYSQVDRVWSILPTLFNLHYSIWAHLNGLETTRVDNVLAFSTVWSMRLTYNYWRRGGYQIGSEDYRWELIKKQIGSVAFFLLNIVFISSIQLVCFLLRGTKSRQLIDIGPSLERDSPNLRPTSHLATQT